MAEAIETILTRVLLAPNEVLIVQAHIRTKEDRENMRQQVQSLFPNNKVAIVPMDWRITAVKPEMFADG